MVMPWTCLKCGHINSDTSPWCEVCSPKSWIEPAKDRVREELTELTEIIIEKSNKKQKGE